MKWAAFLFSIPVILFAACGSSQTAASAIPVPTKPSTPPPSVMVVSEQTLEAETLQAIPTFTPLSGPCPTPSPDEFKDFINRSITIEDNGKTFVTHITSRFWIYLDDRIYPLRDLLNSIPDELIGYVSNGSIRGPQCYPVYFEAVHEGAGLLKIKDFQLSIIIDNNLPISSLPLQ
jgi:hypothetical protein